MESYYVTIKPKKNILFQGLLNSLDQRSRLNIYPGLKVKKTYKRTHFERYRYICTYMYTYTNNTHIHMYIHPSIHPSIHTYIHVYVYIYIDRYIYIYIHI